VWAEGTLDDYEMIENLPENLQDKAKTILDNYEKSKSMFGDQIYLGLDDGVFQSVFSKPGFFNAEDCVVEQKNVKIEVNRRCREIGQIDNKSSIKPTGRIEFKAIKDEDGEDSLSAYTEIQFSFEKNGKKEVGFGWVPQENISFNETFSSYAQIAIDKVSAVKDWIAERFKKTESCDCAKPNLTIPATKNLNDLADVSNAIDQNLVSQENKNRKTVSQISEVISPLVGKCALKPPDNVPTKFKTPINYDEFALPLVLASKVPPGIQNESKKPVTQKELVDIDILARTMYAEMASCTPIGAQYPMAVARVIRNREKAMIDNPAYKMEFINQEDKHQPSKSLLAKAASSPVQFSAWNQEIIDFAALKEARDEKAKEILAKKNIRKPAVAVASGTKSKTGKVAKPKRTKEQKAYDKAYENAFAEASLNIQSNPKTKPKLYYKTNDNGMLHTLCPPSDPLGLCYTGQKPVGNLNAVWQSTLKIATEAVLFPEQFNKKTAELEGIKHYTSGRSSFAGYIQVKASVEGREINSDKCMNLWRKPTAAELAARKSRKSKKPQKKKP
jgi:hypothetical protein